MSSIHEILAANPVIPVVVVKSAAEGLNVGRALTRGGITTAEVTFRTDAAAAAIAAMSDVEGLTVGAGTVVTSAQVHEAADAGAQYIVSPGFNAAVVDEAQRLGLPVLPACTDGSWLMAALEKGIDTVKFFPAEVMGGIAALKALSGPFPSVGFVPTGGVSADNLGEYLSVPAVKACGGTWMVKPALIEAGDWGQIAALSAEAVALARSVER